MSKGVKIFLLIIGIAFSLLSILLIGSCVSMNNEYAGIEMGNEAYGFYSFFCLLATVASVLASVPWIILYVSYRKNKIQIKQ